LLSIRGCTNDPSDRAAGPPKPLARLEPEDSNLGENHRPGTIKTIKTYFRGERRGFDGPWLGKSPKIEAPPEAETSTEELSYASAILGQAGVRLMRLEGGDAVGVWSDLDSPAIRAAIATFHPEGVPVIYLDGPLTPLRFKSSHVPDNPPPTYVREEMERSPESWKVRNRSKWRFVPWPLPAEEKAHAIDPETHIWPIGEWGGVCARGFVSNARFGNQLVIPRTNRKTTKKWRVVNGR
jgi:hypothetical protein